jgi:hypothetical protein
MFDHGAASQMSSACFVRNRRGSEIGPLTTRHSPTIPVAFATDADRCDVCLWPLLRCGMEHLR